MTNIEPLPTDLPPSILRTWHEAFASIQRADQIKAYLPGLDEKIARARENLAYLTNEHKRAGCDITAALTDAETAREMVELWCERHGRPLPPEPESTTSMADLDDTTGQQALPAGDALTDERVRQAEALGHGTAGEATTRTVIDALAGGGAAETFGDFQPENGDGPGEGRA